MPIFVDEMVIGENIGTLERTTRTCDEFFLASGKERFLVS
jgi:hypothetical protein